MELKKYERKLEWFQNPEKLNSIINKHLLNKTMYFKYQDNPSRAKIIEIKPNFSYLLQTDLVLEKDQDFVIYSVLGRYIEIHFQIENLTEKKGVYLIRIEKIGISLIERNSIRIPVKFSEAYLTNFRISKHLIDEKVKVIPTSIKVGISEFENKLRKLFDIVKTVVFDFEDPLYLFFKKNQKSVFVENTYKLESFQFQNENFFSLSQLFQNQLQNKIGQYRKDGIKSEIYTPLFYLTHDRNYICIGYIQIQSKTRILSIEEDFHKIIKFNEELIERMQKINTANITEKEELINLSRDGFRIRIKNSNLINYLIHQSGFTCDLVAKEHSPFTLYVEIRSSIKKNNMLEIGAKIIEFIQGDNSRKRFLELISIYEKKYQISQNLQKNL